MSDHRVSSVQGIEFERSTASEVTSPPWSALASSGLFCSGVESAHCSGVMGQHEKTEETAARKREDKCLALSKRIANSLPGRDCDTEDMNIIRAWLKGAPETAVQVAAVKPIAKAPERRGTQRKRAVSSVAQSSVHVKAPAASDFPQPRSSSQSSSSSSSTSTSGSRRMRETQWRFSCLRGCVFFRFFVLLPLPRSFRVDRHSDPVAVQEQPVHADSQQSQVQRESSFQCRLKYPVREISLE